MFCRLSAWHDWVFWCQDAKRDMRSALSRKALLSELRAKKLVDIVPEEVRQIYVLLESDFSPLELCAQVRSSCTVASLCPMYAIVAPYQMLCQCLPHHKKTI